MCCSRRCARYSVFYFRAFPFVCFARSDGESARVLTAPSQTPSGAA